MAWAHRVKVKQFYIEKEDHESIQKSMTAIADVLDASPCFTLFLDVSGFRNIPRGDDIFGPVDYANRLLDCMYDYADASRIWIE